MKKIQLIFVSIFIIVLMSSCEENELLHYDGSNAIVQFVKVENNLRVKENLDNTIEVKISTSTLSDTDRIVSISIDPSLTNADSANYSLSTTSVVIPANSYEGSFEITGMDDDNIDDVGKQIAIKIDSFDGAHILDGFGTQIVKLFEICPNSYVNLSLAFTDGWPSEISWEIKQDDVIIASVATGTYPQGTSSANEVIELNGEGQYTFTIFDAYGDGMHTDNGDGSYKLILCVESLASGGGNFGSSESTTFIKY